MSDGRDNCRPVKRPKAPAPLDRARVVMLHVDGPTVLIAAALGVALAAIGHQLPPDDGQHRRRRRADLEDADRE